MIKLEKGDKAPDFTGTDDQGNVVKLKDFKGKKLILFFYPKDNTPGCTAEACNLQENYEYWHDQGYSILGISPDSVESHRKFKAKFNFKYMLISDPEKEIMKTYGTYGPKMMYGKEVTGVLRTTFIVDESGIINHIFKKVDTKNHSEQIIKSLKLN
ncbi:MAG TPA: thioredoxin-dependent thiol peroxidase [Saprospiraceae bacterium]|nr:thioredoxin-dependent thiol peroxidase [Saprospirales bacterium]HRQ31312.1 thioredoxin-dependent thiol peroxidase [Saprospiraceae bacterium]